MKLILVAAAVLGLLAGSSAYADDGCSVPKAEWQPEQALRQKLEGAGWKVNRVKVDDGCYEVYGTDAKGQRAETYFDPKSLEQVDTRDDG